MTDDGQVFRFLIFIRRASTKLCFHCYLSCFSLKCEIKPWCTVRALNSISGENSLCAVWTTTKILDFPTLYSYLCNIYPLLVQTIFLYLFLVARESQKPFQSLSKCAPSKKVDWKIYWWIDNLGKLKLNDLFNSKNNL